MLIFKKTIPFVWQTIPLLALLLACANFYWIHLKDKKVLNLVYVEGYGKPMQTKFAIVNGGTRDLLITKLECSFGSLRKDKTSLVPAQRVEFLESDSWLLPSEKAFLCTVTFTEKFTASFVKIGKPETVNNNQLLYMQDMYVDISWVEMDGTCFNKHIKLIKCGFNEEGEIRQKAPVSYRKPINAYK